MQEELRILLSSSFGANNPFGFAIFSRSDVEDSFLASRYKHFLAGGQQLFLPPNFMLFLAGSCLCSVSRRQLLLLAVKVWLLHGFQILLSSTCNHVRCGQETDK